MSDRKLYKAEYYKRNRERQLEKVKAWRDANPDHGKEWFQKNATRPKIRFAKAKAHVKDRNKNWGLTLEQYIFLIEKPCSYCEKSMIDERGIGLDRLDNSKGYELNNVIPCCKICNTCRNDFFTPEEWKVAITAILQFRKQVQS